MAGLLQRKREESVIHGTAPRARPRAHAAPLTRARAARPRGTCRRTPPGAHPPHAAVHGCRWARAAHAQPCTQPHTHTHTPRCCSPPGTHLGTLRTHKQPLTRPCCPPKTHPIACPWVPGSLHALPMPRGDTVHPTCPSAACSRASPRRVPKRTAAPSKPPPAPARGPSQPSVFQALAQTQPRAWAQHGDSVPQPGGGRASRERGRLAQVARDGQPAQGRGVGATLARAVWAGEMGARGGGASSSLPAPCPPPRHGSGLDTRLPRERPARATRLPSPASSRQAGQGMRRADRQGWAASSSLGGGVPLGH